MSTKIRGTSEAHEAFFKDMVEVLRKYGLPAQEMLAIVSNLVGRLIANQDCRIYSRQDVMKVVGDNIELGNQQAMAEIEAMGRPQ
jgi:uncharacterized protein YejL (UPF0352 family)